MKTKKTITTREYFFVSFLIKQKRKNCSSYKVVVVVVVVVVPINVSVTSPLTALK
ncbi:hypothetical protein BC952_2937 [Flavobacterium limicola]|uniref:Uncharacterized protein n=1 Tax=Flavobacterium limicola TaxID=180441 RepID=A0A495RR54_9FLAO|nr:hypothetical protein [Flavobacterium limicola]RKS89759.1 hypothetical protein BC952_2937 [Flavobacterium limicola]